MADITSGEGFETCASIIPLSRLGNQKTLFLAIQVDDEACPVYLFEAGAFYPVTGSLDSFLTLLYNKKDIPPRSKAIQALEKAKDFCERGAYQKGLDLLTPQVLVGLGSSGWRSRFKQIRGRCCAGLGLASQAEALLGKMSLEVLFMYLVKRKDYGKGEEVLRAMEAYAAEAPKERRCWDDILHGGGMLALVRGDDAAAKNPTRRSSSPTLPATTSFSATPTSSG